VVRGNKRARVVWVGDHQIGEVGEEEMYQPQAGQFLLLDGAADLVP